MPSTGTFAMQPCMIPVLSARVGEKSLSALQVLKCRETTYLAVLNWQEIEESSGTLPKPVKQVLADFEDVNA